MQTTETKRQGGAAQAANASNPIDADAVPTAAYIAQMANELARLARFTGLNLLTHLLDMARLEAEICARAGSEYASFDDA